MKSVSSFASYQEPQPALRTAGVTRRPKILQVVESTSAGVGKHVIDLVSNLDLTRFDVAVAYSPLRADSLFLKGLAHAAAGGVETFEVPMRREVSVLADLASFRRLRRLIAVQRFDLIHTHGSKAGFLGRFAARCVFPTPLTLYTPHAISLFFSRKYWAPEKLAGLATDALIAVSQSERCCLNRFQLVDKSKLHCVTAGIDIGFTQTAGSVDQGALRRELGLSADATIIGTVGRIAPQKDPCAFLRSVPLVCREAHNAYFVWIGDGEQKAALEHEAERLGVSDKVRFLGYRADAVRLMAGFDIFALTSRYESFGYVTCEAMALGKPVVATRVEGSVELVEDGVTGFLFESGDVETFAHHLLRIIREPQLGMRMGLAGLARAEHYFRLERMVAETEALYGQLLVARGWMHCPSGQAARPNQHAFAGTAQVQFPMQATEKETA